MYGAKSSTRWRSTAAYATAVSKGNASSKLMVLQGSRPWGVTSCQCRPASLVRWISPSSVPTQSNPAARGDGAMAGRGPVDAVEYQRRRPRETVFPLRHRYPEGRHGPGRDVLRLARAPVEPMHAAVGVAAVDDVGIERVGGDGAALARAHRGPLTERDLPEIAAARHPGGARLP